jgi:hypothetical protein
VLSAGKLELLRQLFFETVNPWPRETPGTVEADRRNAAVYCSLAEDGVRLAQQHAAWVEQQGVAASALDAAVAAAWLQEMQQLLKQRQALLEECAAVGLQGSGKSEGGEGVSFGVVV